MTTWTRLVQSQQTSAKVLKPHALTHVTSAAKRGCAVMTMGTGYHATGQRRASSLHLGCNYRAAPGCEQQNCSCDCTVKVNHINSSELFCKYRLLRRIASRSQDGCKTMQANKFINVHCAAQWRHATCVWEPHPNRAPTPWAVPT